MILGGAPYASTPLAGRLGAMVAEPFPPASSPGCCTFIKTQIIFLTPGEALSATLDFSGLLDAADAISSVVWTVDTGVVIGTQTFTDTTVTVTGTIPAAVEGEDYFLLCVVSTALGIMRAGMVEVRIRTLDPTVCEELGWWRL